MKKNIIIISIFNIFALPLLVIGVLFLFLQTSGVAELYLFGQVGGVAILMCLSFGITIEGVMLFVLAIANKKIEFFLPNIILVPVVLFMVFNGMWGYSNNYEIKLEKYNETIVVKTWRFLRFSGSTLYEKNFFISASFVSDAPNSSFYTFESTRYYKIDEYNNGILITYHNNYEIYLKYVDNHFYKVNSLEEII